ncbi:AcrB/AcrD/AcrF family protein [Sphingomonas sp.]|uniref:AcrB/AcrD/AcrF family protein n=1 Tax=Sphingomonas sp. TaxID=28214 RepID=UPI00286E1075|nr:AcrB/AcrD/AcrF family protein [Sphingomonas sp.]
MSERNTDLPADRAWRLIDRHWTWLVAAAWLLFCAWFVYSRWAGIHAFALGDTDDNLRMSQVRALLAGQDWFDLRQYRLSPPVGANIHWSRLVDLPLAALILLLRPLVGGADAERIAVAVAPMLPFLLLLFGVSLTVRRLVDRRAFPLAFVALFLAGSTLGMFMPTRIDHHGWQLALLSLAVAGLADPKRARGGATVGIATALSLAIGLELLIYLALAGVATVLMWIDERDQRRRLAAYAATLAGGTALSFLVFASYANRAAVCDALSPVWLADALLGGALLLGLAMLSPGDWKRRLALAAAAGVAVAAFHALAWPHCLARLEGVSPEVQELWLSHVREARPVYRHGAKIASLIVALPITGLFGWALLAWLARGDRDRLRRVLAALTPAFAAAVLLLWQTRTGPAAQMLAVTGAVTIVWVLAPLALASRHAVVRVLGPVAVTLIGLGAVVPLVSDALPGKKQTKREIAISKANRQCPTLAALRPIAEQPKGMVFSFVDFGPRLITVTHHDAVIGPYHRNGEQIGDVMKAFRGSADNARAILAKYRADYLLVCPNSSTTTIFMAEAPKGFYGQLERGEIPPWLEPIKLPDDSPYRMWRVRR